MTGLTNKEVAEHLLGLKKRQGLGGEVEAGAQRRHELPEFRKPIV